MDHPAVPMKIRRGIRHAAPCATASARIVVPRQLSHLPHCAPPAGSPRASRRWRVRHSAVCAYTTICSSPWSRCLRCSRASGSSGVRNNRARRLYRCARRSIGLQPAVGALRVLVGLCIALVVGGLILACLSRPSRRRTARMLDRSFDLKERLTTALDHLGRGVPREGERATVVYLQMADAANAVTELRRQRSLGVRVPVRELVLIVFWGLLLAALFFLRGVGGGLPQMTAGAVPRFTPAVERPPEPQPVDDAAAAAETAPSVEDVMRLSERSSEAQRDLQALARALDDHAVTRSAAEAIARGDYDAAAEELRDLAPNADDLSPAARQELARDLDQAASEMSPGSENTELGDGERGGRTAPGRRVAREGMSELGDAVEQTGGEVASQQELAERMRQAQGASGEQGEGGGQGESSAASSPLSELIESDDERRADRLAGSPQRGQPGQPGSGDPQSGDGQPGDAGQEGGQAGQPGAMEGQPGDGSQGGQPGEAGQEGSGQQRQRRRRPASPSAAAAPERANPAKTSARAARRARPGVRPGRRVRHRKSRSSRGPAPRPQRATRKRFPTRSSFPLPPAARRSRRAATPARPAAAPALGPRAGRVAPSKARSARLVPTATACRRTTDRSSSVTSPMGRASDGWRRRVDPTGSDRLVAGPSDSQSLPPWPKLGLICRATEARV